LSPANASPPVAPSSNNCWLAAPPIADRSVVTVRPVLEGFVPGVPVTVSTDDAKILGDRVVINKHSLSLARLYGAYIKYSLSRGNFISNNYIPSF
jgi:hypothetical protein